MNEKMQTARDLVFVFVLASVGSLLLATPAPAQTIKVDRTDPFSATVENPCVPELVPVDGVLHTNETTTFEKDGSVEFRADDTIEGTGVGDTTMAGYEYNDKLRVRIIFDPIPGPILIRTKTKLVADGDVADYLLTAVFEVTGDGQPSTTTIEEECRR